MTVWDVRWVATTGSTNADVAAGARDGAAEGFVVVADHQSAGRGRLDRRWEAPPGTSLAMSFLLRPDDVPGARWPWLPLLAGVAVTEAVERAAGASAVLKWPNDVLLAAGAGDVVGKLAGILTERVETERGPAAVVGIGLNVSQTPEQLPPGAASLAATGVEPTALFDAVADRLAAWYGSWRAAGGDLMPSLAAAYRDRCDTIGREVRAELPDGAAVDGRATGVDDSGRLVVDTGAGTVVVGAGDVVHLRPR
ncbi:biotin--[acetyl-CoA-carboxylase] ligase [Jiangella asiatica]|uniref:biotin--[biotin carboxyl-carrier protein] ligase n=1 Tax=Jiangella asiatica TaxID=2530372 RepID=A0A4R5DQ98_9ACTN|nr:biotin--[acetyl-CoA-carboxylase] ligase [Jiangella asiatica]TDE15817.1 biotin--[acetyl-CoA-carboxylase] ligase [Jiangella asiatica]